MAGLDGAFKKAAIKLGVGLFLIAGLVGARIATVDRGGVEGEIAELEAAQAALEAESSPATAGMPAAPEADSLVARVSDSVRARFPGGDAEAAAPDPDRLVRCRLPAETQFSRAADCLSRGGDAEELD